MSQLSQQPFSNSRGGNKAALSEGHYVENDHQMSLNDFAASTLLVDLTVDRSNDRKNNKESTLPACCFVLPQPPDGSRIMSSLAK